MKIKVLFFFMTLQFCLGAQTLQEYFFNNNFNGTAGGGPLTEVLACGAGLGSFGTQTITTTAGFCSNSTAFCFNDGGGLSYPNNSITSQYTINLFCKFNALSGYTRIIDFSNGTSDNGVYLLNNCLVLYPNGTVGPCPYFNPNLYYLFTFVRDAATNTISVYVNGTFFSSYVDATNLYRPATSTTPIIFFRDDAAVPCEAAPGCIGYASISSSTLSPAQVNTVWVNICNTVSSCTATAGSNYSVCPGQTATLGGTPTAVGGSGTFTYSWSPSAGLNNATIANPVATATVQTTYTVTINDGAGCIRTDTVKIFMNPVPAVTASPAATICPGASTTLTAGGAVSYTWSPATGLSAVNGATVTATPAASTIYTVTGSNASGCINSTTVQVTVSPNPVIAASPNASICPSGSATLTASGGMSYTWSPSGSLSAANGSSVIATPAATTVYTVTGANADGCIGTASVQVTLSSNAAIAVSPHATVCPAASATLMASGGVSYTWSPGGSLNAVNGASVIATPVSTTVYTVTGTNAAGCIGTNTILITVSTNPVLSGSPNATICASASTTLTASGATSYTWSPAGSLSSPNGATVIATPAATTVYTVTGANASGCTNSTTVQVTVSPNPVIAASPNASICPSGSATLTASGGMSYTWSPSGSLSAANGASVIATPAATTVYTVTGANADGCIGTASVQVTLSSNAAIAVSPHATVCPAASATLMASGGVSYTWSPGGSLNAVNGASVIATPASTTVYTVTGTNAAGCIGTNTILIAVSTNPVLSGSPNATICASASTTLTASGATSYTWSPAGSLSSPTGATVTANPAATTVYTVTGANASGCTGTYTVSVAVANNPTVVAVGGTLCAASSVTLTASGAISYTWSPATGLNAVNAASVIATPPVTTTYTVTGITGSCTGSAVATASVITVNTAVTASSNAYCIGATGVTLTGTGASTYSWSPPFGLSATLGATVSASPTITTTYTVTGSTGACSGSQTITITVAPVSSLSIVAGNTLICPNGSGTTLMASGGATYTWAPGGQTTSTLQVNPPNTTTYTLVGQSAAGCATIPAIITVSVSPAINATLTASSPSVCLGKTVSISAMPSGGAYTYTWLPVSAIQGSNSGSSIIASPGSTATVIYTVTISNGFCRETNTIPLQVFNCVPPVSSFSTLTNDSICTKGCVTFTATSTGIQPFTYQWFFPGGTPPTSNSSNPVICYPLAGSYPVSLITGNMFGNDTVLFTNYIHVVDTPSIRAFGDTLISVGQTAPVKVTGNGSSYYWSPDNGTIACPTCTNTVVQPTVTTQYIVTAYNSPYCKKQDTVLVKVDFVCGDFFIPNVFSPNGDGLNDDVNIHGFCIATYVLKIFNRWGEKVFETTDKTMGWDGTFRGKPMDTGVFVYTVEGMTIDRKPFSKKGNITLLR